MLQNKNNHTIIGFVLCVIVATFTCIQHAQAESMHINNVYSDNKIIPLDNLRSDFAYLSAYGKCQFGSNSEGIARIILVDDEGGEFLVGEWDKRFSTDSVFSNMCVETANLRMKRISHIKIIVHNAILHIDSLEWFSNPLLAAERATSRINITPAQKADQWNNYNAAHGKLTIDGGTFRAGMYLYSLIADGQLVDTKQMILAK